MTIEDSIEVTIRSEYLDEQSLPDQQRYVFAYHIRITNHGEHAATLRRRHWFIANGDGDIQEVMGEGVVGEQPRIEPGAHFEYSSGCVLTTRVGSMRGYYVMQIDDGNVFHATIPVFTLATPNALN